MMERKRLARSSLGLLLAGAACAAPSMSTGGSAGMAWQAQSELGTWSAPGPARLNDGSLLEVRWSPAAGVACAGVAVSLKSDGPWKKGLQASTVYELSPGLCGVLIAAQRRAESQEADRSSSHAELRLGDAAPITLEITPRVYESEQVQGLPPDYVEPPKRFMPRIRREIAEIGRLYGASAATSRLWSGPFRNPVAGSLGADARIECRSLPSETPGCIKSRFGKTRTYNGQPRSPHPGTDLKAPLGQSLVAPARARVVLAKNLYFTGNTVILDHGAGLVTVYAHLSKLAVKKGALVEPGAPIGLSGATGRAVGAHLHWGAVLNRIKLEPLDLMGMLK